MKIDDWPSEVGMDVSVVRHFHENIIDVFNVAPSKFGQHSNNVIPKLNGDELVHDVVSPLDFIWCDEAAVLATSGAKPNIQQSE